jgi:hypothetical protein
MRFRDAYELGAQVSVHLAARYNQGVVGISRMSQNMA